MKLPHNIRSMVDVRYHFPEFTEQDAVRFAHEHYGLQASARPLPSERDQNFHLATEDGKEFVLKIANATEERAVLDLQNQVMEHLALREPGLEVSRLCRTTSGKSIADISSGDGKPHFLRLLTYIPGKLLANVRPHSDSLLRSLGHVLATLNHALQGFDHPAAHRVLKWDLARGLWIREYMRHLVDPLRRKLVKRHVNHFELYTQPVLVKLPCSVIYNDANDYNVLVGRDPRDYRVIGVIDFGDIVYSNTVSDLAVGLAYAMLGKNDPMTAAYEIVSGYHEKQKLEELEIKVLFSLAVMRLCISVTNSGYQRTVEPDNEYLVISEAPAWDLLEKLDAVSEDLAHFTFRDACGLAACPRTPMIVRRLQENRDRIGPVVDMSCGAPAALDLSIGSLELGNLADFASPGALTELVFARMKKDRANVGIGRYNEVRAINTTDAFRVEGNNGPEWRTLHLGMDLFAEPGTRVLAPLDGTVHSFRNNDAKGDYGPTIILQHEDGVFFTMYGHLGLQSLQGLVEGKTFKKGDVVGTIGDSTVNGGWTPHVHFQLIADMLGLRGTFPGLALPRRRSLWLSLCPDPNLIIRSSAITSGDEMSGEQILQSRKEHIGKSLSVSYAKPLHIVRGSMQYLYDEDGRAYLDAVNNVPHVGHSHPRVVETIARQMAVLNTNTRYLHENLARYAGRLCATLPKPLSVCFFLNSGSEANELALRMARAHTKAKDLIVVDVAYHGNTTTLVEISPYKFDGPGGSGAPDWVRKAALPDPYRGAFGYDDPRAGEKYARAVADAAYLIRGEGRALCGFIAESVLSCAGQIVLPPGYLQHAYKHTRDAGGVCIADEVQVGFGRVGAHFWAFETQSVVPDIVTLGKPIGNGHPLGAVITTPEIAASFANGMEFFSTFGGNPVSCAAGLAVLDVIAAERLQQNAFEVGEHLMSGLRELKEKHAVIGDVRGLGLFVGVEMVLDRETREPAPDQAAYAANRMKECGVLVSTDGPFHNVLKIKPPLVFTRANAEFLVSTLNLVLSENFMSVDQH